MKDLEVGIRELKTHLSQYLLRVKKGKTVIITEHGKPIGRILPVEPSLNRRIDGLISAGLVSWNGEKLPSGQPPATNRGNKLVSDIVVEMRE
ncbi:MAG: type II toxin-antitoxin system prevent-host-death family antitoxin [Anaerolineaceae bacterium]|nr:type II toxin-antitoxin system prevent-host-death family antitoxin [Anaerolineaceae bacterium]